MTDRSPTPDGELTLLCKALEHETLWVQTEFSAQLERLLKDGAPAGVVSAFAEPSVWCAGAVLDVAGCAVCASAAPSSWHIGAVLVVPQEFA